MDMSSLYFGVTEEDMTMVTVSYAGDAGDDGDADDAGWPENPLKSDMTFRVIMIILYSLVFATSVLGNLAVITVILCHRKMRSFVNFFLANLAAADLSVGIFCILPNLSNYMKQEWLTGLAFCKLQHFVQNINYMCSIVILTLISLERYLAIIHPMLSRRLAPSSSARLLAVGLVWFASTVYSIPILVAYKTHYVPSASTNQTDVYCVRSAAVISSNVYAVVNFILLYLLPLALMIFVYCRISVVLWKSSGPPGDETLLVGNNSFRRMQGHEIRTAKMTRGPYQAIAVKTGSAPTIEQKNKMARVACAEGEGRGNASTGVDKVNLQTIGSRNKKEEERVFPNGELSDNVCARQVKLDEKFSKMTNNKFGDKCGNKCDDIFVDRSEKEKKNEGKCDNKFDGESHATVNNAADATVGKDIEMCGSCKAIKISENSKNEASDEVDNSCSCNSAGDCTNKYVDNSADPSTGIPTQCNAATCDTNTCKMQSNITDDIRLKDTERLNSDHSADNYYYLQTPTNPRFMIGDDSDDNDDDGDRSTLKQHNREEQNMYRLKTFYRVYNAVEITSDVDAHDSFIRNQSQTAIGSHVISDQSGETSVQDGARYPIQTIKTGSIELRQRHLTSPTSANSQRSVVTIMAVNNVTDFDFVPVPPRANSLSNHCDYPSPALRTAHSDPECHAPSRTSPAPEEPSLAAHSELVRGSAGVIGTSKIPFRYASVPVRCRSIPARLQLLRQNVYAVRPLLGSRKGVKGKGNKGGPPTGRRRVIRLLIAIVVSFSVCTLPNHFRQQYQLWAESRSVSIFDLYVVPITTLIYYLNSCLNPFFYALISQKFRAAFVEIDWFFLRRIRERGGGGGGSRHTSWN